MDELEKRDGIVTGLGKENETLRVCVPVCVCVCVLEFYTNLGWLGSNERGERQKPTALQDTSTRRM